MDKIRKFLRRLTLSEQLEFDELIEKITSNNLSHLDIKRLQGYVDYYRVRKGTFRIIFKKTPTGNRLIEVTRRNDNTYRDY